MDNFYQLIGLREALGIIISGFGNLLAPLACLPEIIRSTIFKAPSIIHIINQMQKRDIEQAQRQPILFYGKNQPFGFMSNFYPSPFSTNKKLYKTTEHYFQSKKFEGSPHQQAIIDAGTPAQAFKLGRTKTIKRRHDWDQIKNDIMLEALRYKFTVHKQLREKLIETGSRKLVEHTFKDHYWADGGDGSGKNMLGKLLMKIREEFQQKQK